MYVCMSYIHTAYFLNQVASSFTIRIVFSPYLQHIAQWLIVNQNHLRQLIGSNPRDLE